MNEKALKDTSSCYGRSLLPQQTLARLPFSSGPRLSSAQQ